MAKTASDVAAAPSCHIQQSLVAGRLFRPLLAVESLPGAPQCLHALLGRHRLEFKHGGTGKQSIVNAEIRVIGGGGNENDAPIL